MIAPALFTLRVGKLLVPLPLLAALWMPASHMLGVGVQVRPRSEVVVVELQLQMMSLQVGQHEHAGHRARKLPEAIKDVLGLKRHALLELLTVYLCARAHPGALLPRPRGVGVERTARTELALYESLNGCSHVGVVGWAVTLEDSLKPRGVRQRPALVCVVAEPQPGDFGVATGPQHRVAVEAVVHPASQTHSLQHQHASVAAGR